MDQLERARIAAAEALTGARVSGGVVTGRRDGIPIRFAVQGAGWRVTATIGPLLVVGGLHPRAPLARLFIGRVAPAFDRMFHADATIASLITPELQARLVALDVRAIRLTTAGVELEKRYAYYYAEETDIAGAIELVAELARRALAASAVVEEGIRARTPAASPFRGGNRDAADRAVRQTLAALRRAEPRPPSRLRTALWWGLVLALTLAPALLH